METLPGGDCHASLVAVTPTQAFVCWRIEDTWIRAMSAARGADWHGCRLVVRLYDVSLLDFNGLNAHHIIDVPLGAAEGEAFVRLPRPGTSQLAEPGFLLRTGEFLAAARSATVAFPLAAPSRRTDTTSLYVTDAMRPEVVASPWEAETWLEERARPRLRSQLRVAFLAFECNQLGADSVVATYVSRLAAELALGGHDVHVFAPTRDGAALTFSDRGVTVHGLPLSPGATAVDDAWSFAQAVDTAIRDEPPFDLFHLHEWSSSLAPWCGSRPTILSLTSTEGVRRNGAPSCALSDEIEKLEREAARAVDFVLVPDWLRARAIDDLAVSPAKVQAFPMQGKGVDVWDCPMDPGQIKGGIGLGPYDRLVTFVGPLEWGAGPDLLVDSLPTVLGRCGSARIVLVGAGGMHDALWHRAHQLGVAHALRTPGPLPQDRLALLLRASEAVALPSRHRVDGDEHAVWLARRAGRCVVTTMGGPRHLVSHERDGIITYDNPGSMVWAMDRVLGDPQHTEEMGADARIGNDGPPAWAGVARRFTELCAQHFTELLQQRNHDDAGDADAT